MNDMVWLTMAVGLLVLASGAGMGWWFQTRLLRVQRRLDWTEETRHILERHAVEVDLRLAEISHKLQALKAHQQAWESARESAERIQEMHRVLDRSQTAAAASHAEPAEPPPMRWLDTEPAGLDHVAYAQTMPVELAVEERQPPARHRAPGRKA